MVVRVLLFLSMLLFFGCNAQVENEIVFVKECGRYYKNSPIKPALEKRIGDLLTKEDVTDINIEETKDSLKIAYSGSLNEESIVSLVRPKKYVTVWKTWKITDAKLSPFIDTLKNNDRLREKLDLNTEEGEFPLEVFGVFKAEDEEFVKEEVSRSAVKARLNANKGGAKYIIFSFSVSSSGNYLLHGLKPDNPNVPKPFFSNENFRKVNTARKTNGKEFYLEVGLDGVGMKWKTMIYAKSDRKLALAFDGEIRELVEIPKKFTTPYFHIPLDDLNEEQVNQLKSDILLEDLFCKLVQVEGNDNSDNN